MKKTTILLGSLLLIVFTTGCTIDINVDEDELDQELIDLLDDVEDVDIDINVDEDDEDDDETTEEEPIEATGATEGPVTVTIEEGTNFNEYLTYLKRTAYEEDWFDRDSDDCQYFYKMTASQDYPIAVEDFNSEEVQAALLEILEDADEVAALTEAIVDRVNADGDEGARQICSGRNGVFIVFTESHTTMTLTSWDNEALTLDDIKTFEGLIDLSYSFEPDAMPKKAIVMTGYGDAGYLSWNYYLINTRMNTVTKVESCTGHFVSNEDGGSTDQFEFECEKEYTG